MVGARSIELPTGILHSFLNYSTRTYPFPTTWSVLDTGDTKVNIL